MIKERNFMGMTEGIFMNTGTGNRSRIAKKVFELLNYLTNNDPIQLINYILRVKIPNQPPLTSNEDSLVLDKIICNVRDLYQSAESPYKPRILGLVSKEVTYKELLRNDFNVSKHQYVYSRKLDKPGPFEVKEKLQVKVFEDKELGTEMNQIIIENQNLKKETKKRKKSIKPTTANNNNNNNNKYKTVNEVIKCNKKIVQIDKVIIEPTHNQHNILPSSITDQIQSTNDHFNQLQSTTSTTIINDFFSHHPIQSNSAPMTSSHTNNEPFNYQIHHSLLLSNDQQRGYYNYQNTLNHLHHQNTHQHHNNDNDTNRN